MTTTVPLPGAPLRLCYFGNLESPHLQRWMRFFVERGHDVHAISFYQPQSELPGVTVHALVPAPAPSAVGNSPAGSGLKSKLPPSWQRFIQAWRYQRAGLRQVLEALKPDIFHAHYAVEHGFYGAFMNYPRYIVSCWGSDILVESYKPLGRIFARHAMRRAKTVTANDPAMGRRIIEMGIDEENVALIRLGVDSLFVEEPLGEPVVEPIIVSDRALEPLYNVDTVLRAFARARENVPSARLLVAHEGSQRGGLESLAKQLNLGDSVSFLGRLSSEQLRDVLRSASVYVSVPTSDSLSLSTMEAMACGAFPIVSDLPSQDGWLTHEQTALRIPSRDADALAIAMQRALTDRELRDKARTPNRRRVEIEGNRERNLMVMERYYYVVAQRPVSMDY